MELITKEQYYNRLIIRTFWSYRFQLLMCLCKIAPWLDCILMEILIPPRSNLRLDIINILKLGNELEE